jgi:hypothetical protein
MINFIFLHYKLLLMPQKLKKNLENLFKPK